MEGDVKAALCRLFFILNEWHFVYLNSNSNPMTSEDLTPKENRRYQRQIMIDEIGVEGQKKLKKAKVLVVGAGGLGCPVLQYLTAAGVGTLGVMDDEKVDESNLQRQVLYGFSDIGKHKAIIAVKRLREANDLIDFRILNIKLTEKNAREVINAYDIVVDATDNFSSRYLINDVCVALGKPMVYGSIYKFEGQVSVFNFSGGPTLRCLLKHPPEPHEAVPPDEVGVIGVLPGVIGTMQANEVLKMIIGFGPVLSGKLWVFNIATYETYIGSFELNPDNLAAS
jgi:adenylyltransferase/sulfurtransferase